MSNGWDEEEDVMTCPVCKTTDVVSPAGKADSPVLLVGEFPGEAEIAEGRPFVGATGGVLKMELAKLGIDIKALRLCNLWYHAPTKDKACFEYGMNLVIKEAQGRKAILLIGSDTVKAFCDKSVSAVTGLEVKSPYLSAPLIMACIQPAMVFRSSVGEFRLSLQKFAFKMEEFL